MNLAAVIHIACQHIIMHLVLLTYVEEQASFIGILEGLQLMKFAFPEVIEGAVKRKLGKLSWLRQQEGTSGPVNSLPLT